MKRESPPEPILGMPISGEDEELIRHLLKGSVSIPRVGPSPFARGKSLSYRTKDVGSHQGEPCQPGWTKEGTGCIPAKKETGEQTAPAANNQRGRANKPVGNGSFVGKQRVEPKPPQTEREQAATPAAKEPKDTEEKYKINGKWTEERVRAVHKPLLDKMREGVKKAPDGKPVLYMTGGGYGSGKSTLLDMFPEVAGFPKDKAAAMRADPDALKQGIPEYLEKGEKLDPMAATYVHEESSDIAKTGVNGGLADGYNVIYDTSGDTDPDKLADKVAKFRKQGATRVEANYAFSGSIDESQRRADYRAEHSKGARRYVPRALLEANAREVSRCWLKSAERGIFDKLTLYSTAGKFGDPPVLIASAENGKITVHDQKQFDTFKQLGE
jgi:hypothetical protein